MAISRMQRVSFLVPGDRAEELVSILQRTGLVHMEDCATAFGGEIGQRELVPTQPAEQKLERVGPVLATFDEFAPASRGFLASLVNVPVRVGEDELHQTVRHFDIEPLYEECRHISESHKQLQREIEHVGARLAVLEFFRRLPFSLSDLHALRRARVRVGTFSERNWQAFQADPLVQERLAAQELLIEKRGIVACIAALQADEEGMAAVLKRYEFAERPLPEPGKPEEEQIAELRAQLANLQGQCDAQRARVRKLAERRRQVEIVQAHWQAELDRVRAANGGGSSGRISLFAGYVQAADARTLEAAVAKQMPEASVVFEKPGPEDHVPVCLRLNPVLRPVRFLVRMFGLPDYFSFDPTPYLSLSFLIFFGFCFGDVIYGLMLCAVAGYLAWKSRRYEGLNDLCMLFFYGGISTIVVGALTGSWAADLWKEEYLGAGNFLLRLKEHTLVMDPLERPVMMLLLALGMGVANQLYGIGLKGYGLLRRGRLTDALFDAGLWLLMIPGFLICAGKLFAPTMPAWLLRAGVVLAAVGAVGLVLTQGRNEKTLSGKIITGVVSLYGILGSYGCVSFMGDMLSYSRLLALGLTTSIVGMSFNIMAGLVKDVPHVGVVLFVVVVVFGHLFNFAISILGAFVHSARLIFLEFFGRFYQAGGVGFRPLSLSTAKVLVTASQGERQ